MWQGYGQMGYPYGQGQYGQDASMTGQQGQSGSGAAPYGAQQQMPYGQMRMFFDIYSIFLSTLYEIVVVSYELFTGTLYNFYPRDAMLARVFAIATCLSVCLSVTRRYCA